MPVELRDREGTLTARGYRELLVQSRREQLSQSRESLGRLMETYDLAAENLIRRLRNPDADWLTPRQTIRNESVRQMLSEIDGVLTNLATDTRTMLDAGMLELAENAVRREARAAEKVGWHNDPFLFANQSRTFEATNGIEVVVDFSRVAEQAVEAAANRYYRDGLRLSDRLYRLDTTMRQTVEDVIVAGIAEQAPAVLLASRLEDALSAPGQKTPRYLSMRIARTEINNAHREAHIRSLLTESGQLKGYASGIRWNLSLSHPEPDICDVWAGVDMGMGAGLYLPDQVPVDHPHGLCYQTTELRELPGVAGPSKPANVGAVPEGQIAYYAEQVGDPVAVALLDQRGRIAA